jgi:acetyl esterase/lipase
MCSDNNNNNEEHNLLRVLYLMYDPYSPDLPNSTSAKMFGNGDFGLTHRYMKYAMSRQTFQNASDHKNPLAFPLLDKNLSGLPAVYIATMALDALKDDKPKSKTVYLCKFQIDRIVVVLLFLK